MIGLRLDDQPPHKFRYAQRLHLVDCPVDGDFRDSLPRGCAGKASLRVGYGVVVAAAALLVAV
jgi:hypothetical protein